MTNRTNISWVLVGVRPRNEEKLEENVLQRLLEETFKEGKMYTLFLCGTEIDKTGTLEEMEEGFETVSSQLEEYKEGDYCIISKHDEADLLFLPTIIKDDDVEEISGDTTNM